MSVVAPTREAQEIHPLLAAAFSGLDAHAVRWCVLRGEDELDGSARDVDVLVARADFDRVPRLLAGLGFARLPAWGHGSHAFFLAYHAGSDRWIWLDVVTDIRFGRHQSLRVHGAAELLERRVHRSGVAALAPADAFWMLLLHCLLDKDRVPVQHRRRLEQLVEEAREEGPLPRTLEGTGALGWGPERVVEAVRDFDWAGLDELGRRLRRELTQAPPRARLRVLANRTLRAATRVRRTVASRGPIVALLAPDGAGKSTLAAALQRSFPTYDVRVVYMGLYRGTRLPRALQVPGVYVASKVALAWARYLRARLHSAAGRLVVLDRYVYDVLLPSPAALDRGHRAHRWLVGHALPPPDLVLVLDVPGTTAFARKGEDGAASLERQRTGYRELARRLRRAEVVDASRDAEGVRRQAVSLVWSACARRLDRR